MNESKINSEKKEHLVMIEAIITRMANNSFQLKNWAISLISAILIFADYKKEFCFIWIAFLPVIVFWALDAFYLQLERKYRELYKLIQQDYINNTNKVPLFDMNTKDINVACVTRIMISKSVWPIYVTRLGATIVVLLINCLN